MLGTLLDHLPFVLGHARRDVRIRIELGDDAVHLPLTDAVVQAVHVPPEG
jgi:hypothetical protein